MRIHSRTLSAFPRVNNLLKLDIWNGTRFRRRASFPLTRDKSHLPNVAEVSGGVGVCTRTCMVDSEAKVMRKERPVVVSRPPITND